ncbi:MAG: hypothetical protein K2N18_02115, partial [Clostridia bacterium]|nr:hypothetical protein [Clostridia bacterium]
STVRDNIDEDSGASFLPGYSNVINQKIGTGTTATSETGSYSGALTLSSTSKYIGIGLSGHADAWPGYATPESYMHNIKISITISSTISVKCNTNGSFEYYWYPDATATSSGEAARHSTIYAGQTYSETTTNPFAYMVIIPKESTKGYRFDYVKISGTSRDLGYKTDKDNAPNAVSISLFPDSKLSGISRKDSAHSYSYNYRQNKNASEVNFTARQYKVLFTSTDPLSTGNPQTETYTYGTSYTVPNPAENPFNFAKTGSVASSWTYNGSQYTPGNSFSNLVPNLDNNTTTIQFDVVWVDVSATKNDNTITSMVPEPYSDKYSDVTFNITASKTGHTLVQVYAYYTSGDLAGHKIALECIQSPNASNQSKWVLYG